MIENYFVMEHMKKFATAEDYYSYFEKSKMDIVDAINVLIETDTMLSMYVIVQICGNELISTRLSWSRETINTFINSLKTNINDSGLFKYLNFKMPELIRTNNFEKIHVKDLSYEVFKKRFEVYVRKKRFQPVKEGKVIKKGKKGKKSKKGNTPFFNHYNAGRLYEEYEYGLSDW